MMPGLCCYAIGADWVMRRAGVITLSFLGMRLKCPMIKSYKRFFKIREWEKKDRLQAWTTL